MLTKLISTIKFGIEFTKCDVVEANPYSGSYLQSPINL